MPPIDDSTQPAINNILAPKTLEKILIFNKTLHDKKIKIVKNQTPRFLKISKLLEVTSKKVTRCNRKLLDFEYL